MTIQEAIDRVDLLKPNKTQDVFKIAWLSELDGILHHEILMKHEHEEEQEAFDGYSLDTDRDTALLAPAPYDGIYVYYLMSQIDLQNMESQKYNQDKALYNNAYDTFSDYWTRTHMPLTNVRELML